MILVYLGDKSPSLYHIVVVVVVLVVSESVVYSKEGNEIENDGV
jgi:hypothetical protein